MPYKFETDKKRIPRKLDRRVKLTPEQRDEIRNNDLGLSIHALSRKYKVSRRMIQFIRFPERHTKNLEDREKRGGWKQYYSPDRCAGSMREHRRYKQSIKDELIDP